MVTKDVTYQKVSKGKELEVKNQSKVDGKTALALTTSMEGLKFARLRSACKDMGLDFQDALKDPEFKALQLFTYFYYFFVSRDCSYPVRLISVCSSELVDQLCTSSIAHQDQWPV